MKRMLVFFLLLILLSTHFQTISAAFYEDAPPSVEMIQRIEEIFQVRTHTWNSLLENIRDTDLNRIREKLENYVADPLLEEELELYQQIIDDPTSFERIVGLKFNESTLLKDDSNIKEIFLNIIWELEGYDGVSTVAVDYIVEMKKVKEVWFLTDYQVLVSK